MVTHFSRSRGKYSDSCDRSDPSLTGDRTVTQATYHSARTSSVVLEVQCLLSLARCWKILYFGSYTEKNLSMLLYFSCVYYMCPDNHKPKG